MKPTAIMAAVMGVALSASGAIAQEGGNITQVYYVEIKPGHGDQFNAGWTPYWDCYRDNGGQWSWTAWTPASGKLGAVMFRSGGHSWADFDADDPAAEACNEIFYSELFPHFGTVYSGWREYLPNLSRGDDREDNVVHAYDFDVVDTAEALAIIAAWHEAFEAADWGRYTWIQHVTSSQGWDLTVAVLNEDFASMAPEDQSFADVQIAHHGAEMADELRTRWFNNVKDSRSRIYRRTPELSYAPEDQ